MQKAVVFLLLGLAPVSAAAEDAEPLARSPSEMSGAEIDAYNQGRMPTDAGYIRCRKIDQVGSLVRKIRVCNTNADWRRISDKGNQDARDSMEVIARGWSNSQEPKDGLMPAIGPK